MNRGTRQRLVVVALVASPAALIGGGLALQLAAGGIRGQSLSPAVLALALVALGAAVLVRRPQLRFGPLLLVNGLGFAAGTLAAGALDYGSAHSLARPLAQAAYAIVWFTVVLMAAWTLFILWFPDGRFSGGGWRRFFLGALVLCTAVALAGWLAGPRDAVFGFYGATSVPRGAAGPLAGALEPLAPASSALLLLPLVALGSLAKRYRRGGAVVRRQVRWLLAAMAVEIVAQIAGAVLEGGGGAAHAAGVALGVGTQPLPMLAATLAILRHRLWDIEIVVSRALVYGVLWAALSALLLVPPLAAGLLVGGRSALAAVGIALLVTAVFQPTRARLERVAERLVYRHRARPYVVLTSFWGALRTADLAGLGPLLAETAREGLGVRFAGVWLYAGGSLRPLGVAGAAGGPAFAISAAEAARLLDSAGLVLAEELAGPWPEPPAAVVPLVAADELVGVLACGARPGEPLGGADFELLELLGRESALRLRNLRLEAELRDRLEQIERQAQELRRSRERLVSAQDEERRRLERDLHDGVQQQLVGLAVRLRRAAADAEPLLADLADEAENAVFALQELGRGIYPSVLADRGLAAALRAQAARLPLPVRIDADPALAGRRLGREREAALYFVALEALANVQKHAPDAAVDVWLTVDGDHVVLEVVDDGPGFSARRRDGTGLQNMHDRIAAVGGTLIVAGSAGTGTRVSARVPAASPAAQPAEADSRR